MNLRTIAVFFASLMYSNFVLAGWNGVSTIDNIFVYPGYAVVTQGDISSGPANCLNNGAWSFSWSDFDEATQQRIYSALLMAYTTNVPIQVVIDGGSCGPEGYKKFTGQIMLP